MKLLCLGTSHGAPSKDRFTSCYVLEVNDSLYIFDAGAPVTEQLLQKGKDLIQVKAFFNSHFHADHIHGGINMLMLFQWFYKDADLDVCLPDGKTKRAIKSYARRIEDIFYWDKRIRFHVMKPGHVFDDGILRVTAIPVKHFCRPDKRSYAFMIEAQGKKILYTGDLSGGLKKRDFPVIAFVEKFDLILSECAHFSLEALEECMQKVDTKRLVVTHIYPEEKRNDISAWKDKFPFEVIVAEDNLEIEI